MSQTVTAPEELLEREASVERLVSALERVRVGEGCVVLVEGEAGIGKTALLDVVRERALALCYVVLRGRGGVLERDFAHGVARQLYEPLLHAAPRRRREALLEGAARLAAPALGLTAVPEESSERLPGDPGFAVNHGLYWLTANLAEEGPVLLLVDDAHWADSATLQFINYLGRRLEGLPVLVALAVRTGEPGAPRELVEWLVELPQWSRCGPRH